MAIPARKTVAPVDERATDLYDFGTRWDAETGAHEPVQVELYEITEQQALTLLRMETWAANAAAEEDRAVAGQMNMDLMNVFLDILEALFVNRSEMVAATRACASGDRESYTRYIGLIPQVIKQYRDRHGDPEEKPTNRAGRRAAARRA